ncbi:DUF928 domain-containing protein [Leptolyngbya boryana CZ1]|uniref:DUF928 domain-containing protein n=1 Tax=Leptolyngbya boryana CZ1 TaxID=3060204 RepID=A0AA96WQB0_LEPBY|nr:DUF928 domain-containing protein [Leptolyngbya boryana]WNZ44116.1 DUF928 domain-containing protein [Leptolyngbya boryana CZ1]
MLRSITASLAIALLSPVILSPPVQSFDWSFFRFVPPPPPRTTLPGGRARGGASRGDCKNMTPSLTALAPSEIASDPGVSNVWGLTISERPTLWFYLPYTGESPYQAEFVLQDESGNKLDHVTVPLPKQPGTIGIKVSDKVPPLQVGKTYRWFFKVYCGAKEKTPIYVEGVVERTRLSSVLEKELEETKPDQKVKFYAENGLWYDTLTALGQLRQNNSENKEFRNAWTSLLQSAKLQDVADAPIVR